MVKRLLAQLDSEETVRGCTGRNKRLYMLGAVDDFYCAVSGGDGSATACALRGDDNSAPVGALRRR